MCTGVQYVGRVVDSCCASKIHYDVPCTCTTVCTRVPDICEVCMCYTLFTNYKGRVRLSFTLFYACLFNICYMYGHTLSKKYRGVPGCLRHKKTTITTYHSPQKMYNSIMKPGSHLAFLSQHVLQKKHGQCKMAHDKGLDL